MNYTLTFRLPRWYRFVEEENYEALAFTGPRLVVDVYFTQVHETRVALSGSTLD